jgi:hypothetical protein
MISIINHSDREMSVLASGNVYDRSFAALARPH